MNMTVLLGGIVMILAWGVWEDLTPPRVIGIALALLAIWFLSS